MRGCCSRLCPTACLERAFVLFPDPWPKLRHHKRRIVNQRTLADLARVVRPGRRAAAGHRRCRTMPAGCWRPCWPSRASLWTAERARDWREPPADWVPTRYEGKARRAGRQPVFLTMRRAPELALRRPAAPGSSRAVRLGLDRWRNGLRLGAQDAIFRATSFLGCSWRVGKRPLSSCCRERRDDFL